ncbi:MAG: phenylalanine--tRNA ligase subunit beta [Planctomycetota bacterium]
MKLVLGWLKDYCGKVGAAPETAETLTRVGLEVERVEESGAEGVLEGEVTSNRPDWLCYLGVARELAAAHGAALRVPMAALEEEEEPAGRLTKVEIADTDLCPRYTARVITDVAVGPSPEWMRARLEAAGLRSVNNVVDITNYVLLETGQPLHAFDCDKLGENRIVVRRAVEGEELVAIDGTRCALDSSMLVIADAARPVAVAGVMGGLETEVTDATRRVLLESAYFQPASVKATSRKLGLITDASFRFERGVDPEMVEFASRRAAGLMQEIAGGKVARGLVEVNVQKIDPVEVALRPGRIRRVLGHGIGQERAKEVLGRLGFELVRESDEALTFRVPSHRLGDVSRECDLIEELARLEGYDKVGDTTRMPILRGSLPDRLKLEGWLAERLAGAGYFETITLSFVNGEETESLSPWESDGTLLVPNAMRAEESALRKTIVGSLLRVKRQNAYRGVGKVRLFELSKVFLPVRGEKLPREKSCLALYDDEGFRRAKGTVEYLLSELGVSASEVEERELAAVEPGRAIRYEVDGRLLGYVGEVRGSLRAEFDIAARAAVAEIDVDLLEEKARREKIYRRPARFPRVVQDLAIVVDEATRWGDVEKAIWRTGGESLVAVEFFDEYRGKQVAKGKKSLAFSLTFQSEEKTLEAEEVGGWVQGVLRELAERFGARLRE